MNKFSYSYLPDDDEDEVSSEEERLSSSPQNKKKIRFQDLKSVLGTRKIFTSSPPLIDSRCFSSSSIFSSLSSTNALPQQQPLLPPPSSSSSSSFAVSSVFPPSSKVLFCQLEKRFKDKSKARRYELITEIKDELFTKMFQTLRMDENDAQHCLDYVTRSLGIVGKERRDQQSQESIFNKQLESLSLLERNQLYRLLTHEKSLRHDDNNNDGDEEGAEDEEEWTLNEDMLGIFPFLRKRSLVILNNFRDGRKVRDDKIDLQFISDFMHNYCR